VWLGYLLAHGGLAAAAQLSGMPVLRHVNLWEPAAGEGAVMMAVFLFGAAAGLIPAAAAYRRSPLEELR
jgi:hypothetical protein